jgi:predicted nucleotidyltransferase
MVSYDRLHFYRFEEREKRDVIERVRELLAGEDKILLAIVFGSFMRRSCVRDIDLAVYSVPDLSLSDLLSLNAKIELDLGFPVDLVELIWLPPSFRLKVLRNGVPVKAKGTLLYRLVDQAYSELMSLKKHCSKTYTY